MIVAGVGQVASSNARYGGFDEAGASAGARTRHTGIPTARYSACEAYQLWSSATAVS